MSAPSPSSVRDLVRQLRSLALVVEREYSWCHGAGHEPSGPRDGTSARRPGPSDPTGALVLAKGRQRGACRQAATRIRRAIEQLEKAERALGLALEADDTGSHTGPLLPKTVWSKAEIDELVDKQAKRRRQEA